MASRTRRAGSSALLREEDQLLAGWAAGRYSTQSASLRQGGSKSQRIGLRYLFVALGLLGTGLYITSKTVGVRKRVRQDFEGGLQKWHSKDCEIFESTDWSLRINGTEVPLHVNVTELFHGGSHLPEHRKVFFSLPHLYEHLLPPADLSAMASQQEAASGGSGNDVGEAASIASDSPGETSLSLQDEPSAPERVVDLALVARQAGTTSELVLGTHPLMRPVMRPVANWKNCTYRSGVLVSAKYCSTADAIKGMCIKVEPDVREGSWRLHGGKASTAGCEAAGIDRLPVQYTSISGRPFRRSNSTSWQIPLELISSAKLVVRSAADPEFLAAELASRHSLQDAKREPNGRELQLPGRVYGAGRLVARATVGGVSMLSTICFICGTVCLVPAVFLLLPKSLSPFCSDPDTEP